MDNVGYGPQISVCINSRGFMYVVVDNGKCALCNLPKQHAEQTKLDTLLIKLELQDLSTCFVILPEACLNLLCHIWKSGVVEATLHVNRSCKQDEDFDSWEGSLLLIGFAEHWGWWLGCIWFLSNTKSLPLSWPLIRTFCVAMSLT